MIPIINHALGKISKGLIKGRKDLGNKEQVEIIQQKIIIKISQNPEKSPGDLRRLAVTQNTMRNHQLILVWKTLERVKW